MKTNLKSLFVFSRDFVINMEIIARLSSNTGTCSDVDYRYIVDHSKLNNDSPFILVEIYW